MISIQQQYVYIISNQTNSTKMSIETIEYGNVLNSEILKIFGNELTYNELKFYAKNLNVETHLKVEWNRNTETQLVRVWFDNQVVMDKKYSINHSCDMFYHLSELKVESDDEISMTECLLDKDDYERYIEHHIPKNLKEQISKLIDECDMIECYNVSLIQKPEYNIKGIFRECGQHNWNEMWFIPIDSNNYYPVLITDINGSSCYSAWKCNFDDNYTNTFNAKELIAEQYKDKLISILEEHSL